MLLCFPPNQGSFTDSSRLGGIISHPTKACPNANRALFSSGDNDLCKCVETDRQTSGANSWEIAEESRYEMKINFLGTLRFRYKFFYFFNLNSFSFCSLDDNSEKKKSELPRLGEFNKLKVLIIESTEFKVG